MARKRIAVYIASIDKQYQQVFCAGLNKAAQEYDADICIFNCQGFADQNIQLDEQGDAAIYDLAHPENYDGMITLLATQSNKMAQAYLENILLENSGKPHVSIDIPMENSVAITFDDMTSVRELTEHMITAHGRKHFAFIEGPANHPISRNRLIACREVLAKHGLELPDRMVRIGDWTQDGGRKAMEEILKEEKPDIVVCANDYIALGAIEALEENQINTPDEIVVTGFDAIKEAVSYGLPTILRPVDKAADLAVRILLEWIDGKKPAEDSVLFPTELRYGSCCEQYTDEKPMVKRLQSLLKDYSDLYDILSDTGYSSQLLAGVGEETEAGEKIAGFARNWNIKDLHVCVDASLLRANGTGVHDGIYPEEMLLLSATVNGETLPQQSFRTECLLPLVAEENRPPICMVFCPVHYRDLNFGYVAMRYSPATGVALYPMLMLISGALTSLYLQASLRKTAALVEHMALHDTMTGMLNRRGYEKFASELFRNAKKNEKCFAMMSIDMDRMKYINDHYGHQAGDEAICRMGRSLSILEKRGFVCVHVSGDEFLVYGQCKNPADAENGVALLKRELNRMNVNDPWLCDIDASIGVFAAVPREIDMLDGFLTQADRNMYKIKHAKQKHE